VDARAQAAALYTASQVRPSVTQTVAESVESAAQMTQSVIDRTTARVTALWERVDPYDGRAVEQFSRQAAQVTVAAQDQVARIHVASQARQLESMGVTVRVTPSVPEDVRLASRADTPVSRPRVVVEEIPDVDIEYGSNRVQVTMDPEDSTTVQVFNRPARAYRYQKSIGADDATAVSVSVQRIEDLVDGNAILAQRMAEEQVLANAVDLDNPIIGWRRIIHPEVVTKTGVCGLCVAAATRFYHIRNLKAIHSNCNCTIAAVTEDEDPGLELNEEDFDILYSAAGEASGGSRSTFGRDLKKIRYRTDEHGELGLVLKPRPGERIQHFTSENPDGFITLYHATSDKAAAAIVKEGFAPKYDEGIEASYAQSQGAYGFFTRRPGGQAGYGDATVAVRVSKSAVERDPWSGHVRVKLADLPKDGFTLHRPRR